MILLYHLVFPDDTPRDAWNAGKVLRLTDFIRQMRWLRERYQLLPLREYLQVSGQPTTAKQRPIAITFDDGYQSTFDMLANFMENERVPATFFVNTSHLEDGRLLWFVYFNTLCFEKVLNSVEVEGRIYPLTTEKQCFSAWRKLISAARRSGDAIAYSREIEQRYPLPSWVIQKYLGLSEAQITRLGQSSLLSIAAHTHRHPYLDQLSAENQLLEIDHNKCVLQSLSSCSLDYFAYPGGVYNHASIAAVQQADFSAAFAVHPRNLSPQPLFEIPRTDVYSSSLLKLRLKIAGLDKLLRHLTQRKA